MKKTFHFICGCMLLYACDTVPPTNPGSCASEGMDNIEQTDLVPDAEINSVDSFVYEPGSPSGFVPVPANAFAIAYIDADGDAVSDFVFIQRHYYHFSSNTSAEENYESQKTVTGTQTDHYIKVSADSTILFFNESETITPEGTWINQVKLEETIASSTIGPMPNGTVYIGIQLIKNEKKYIGWIALERTDYTLKIKATCLNHTACNSIEI